MKKIKMVNKLRFILAQTFLMSTLVLAGEGNGSVEIEHVGTYNSKDLVFFFTSTHTGQPSCNSYRSRWVLDVSTSVGKAQYSLLLSAQAAGKNVRIWGANTCSLWVDSETASVVGYIVDYSTHP